MELSESLRNTLASLKHGGEMVDAKILQNSETYQRITQDIRETAANLVSLIRKHEEMLVCKATEMSQLSLREMEEKKEDIAAQIEEIENLLSYNDSLSGTSMDEETNVDDKQEWEEAITSKMQSLCTIQSQLKPSEEEFMEFKSLLMDPRVMGALCHYGEISTSYGIEDEGSKQTSFDLIDFDENANVVKQNQQSSHEETDSSYETIPFL